MSYVIQFGKKYKGKDIANIPAADLDNYVDWLEKSDIREGSYMHKNLVDLKKAVTEFRIANPVKPKDPEPEKKEEKEQLGPKGRKPNTNKNDPYKKARESGEILRVYMTSEGNELPLINLKGKEYLEVKYRLVWFRSEHPDWAIETEYLTITDKSAHARAVIKDATGRVLVTSHKFENIQGFNDFIEKAETGAIGRALALLGYGTQFCADELEEGDRIVDSPVGKGKLPSEPEVPKIEVGPVISIRLPKRNKIAEKKLRDSGFTYDWVTHAYLRYYDDRFDVDALGFEYEVLESPVN